MVLDFELVRGDERLLCDWSDWLRTIELARAFGWKPKSRNLTLNAMCKIRHGCVDVADEDAQSLAQAIARCSTTLAANRRPTREQIARLMMLSSKSDFEGSSFRVRLSEPARIASFCHGGGFRMKFKAVEATENREITEVTNGIS
jgi:hypothetical protein